MKKNFAKFYRSDKNANTVNLFQKIFIKKWTKLWRSLEMLPKILYSKSQT